MSIYNTNYAFKEIHTYFTEAEKIFFIGIGGISMSAIANFAALMGKEVFGYDKERTKITQSLEKIGKIKYYSTPDNVRNMDMVIYTNAIDENNFEYKRAKKLGIPTISRANFLGYIISLHKYKIGVSGTHGKSTTTSMLCHIFDTACKNPTCFCGAEMINFNSNCKLGGSREYCIFEACEYSNSFLSLPTTDAVVLNIDFDHPDFFASLNDTIKSFEKFIKNANKVYVNCDDENSKSLCHKSIITFGFSDSATYKGEFEKSDTGIAFSVYKHKEFLTKCHLSLYGSHIASDALCAFAVAHSNGIPPEIIADALSTFKSSRRRLEFFKKTNTGSHIFEDYAHHPTEISASLSALRDMGYNKILCVFQPHTYSRSYFLYNRFTQVFKNNCELIVYSVFSAREDNVYELSEETFTLDCGGRYITSLKEIAKEISETDCDCVVLMSAGDMTEKLKRLL